MDEGIIGDFTLEHVWLFIIEIGIEFILEILWTILIIPVIKKHTILKNFSPSASARLIIEKELGYLAVMSIITYPMMLFMILR